MKPLVRSELALEKEQWRRLREYRPGIVAVVLAIMFLPVSPFDFPFPGTNFVMSSLIAVIVGFVIIAVAIGLSRGKAGTKGAIPPAAGAVLAGVGFVFILAALASLPPVATTGGPAAPGSILMGMTLLPSIDTTASYPAGSYTACTSHTFSGSIGGTTGVGVVWTTGTGKLQSQTSAVYLDTVTTTKSNPTWRTANCYQIAFALTYQGVPTASGGGGISEPIYVQVASMSYAYTKTNNSIQQNLPVIAQDTAAAVFGDWNINVLSTGSTWYSLAPYASVGGTLPTTGFPWIQVGTNAGGAASSTFKIAVNMNWLGPWGYTTNDFNSFAGATWSITFNIGLPNSLTQPSLGNAYANPVQFTLVDQHQ